MKIKEINIDNRPREKMIKYGADKLSNEELVAILLRTGNKDKGVIELAYEIINYIGDINKLVNMSYHDMIKINGIGSSKACSLIAAFELTKRAMSSVNNESRYDNPKDIIKLISPLIVTDTVESLYAVYINSNGGLIEYKKIASGSFSSCSFPRTAILQEALKCGCMGVILCHNHPSGNVMPSQSDIEETDRIRVSCEIIGITFVDHVIISKNKYYSFGEKGLLI